MRLVAFALVLLVAMALVALAASKWLGAPWLAWLVLLSVAGTTLVRLRSPAKA